MNDFLTAIFLKVAEKMGFTLQPKKYDTSDFFEVYDLSITSAISDRLSTITLTDSNLSVNGTNERAYFLNDFAERFWNTRIKSACVAALGTGDCLLKPNIVDDKIAVDIISNNNFCVTENIGDYIYGVLIKCDKFKKDNDIFERVEYHRLRTTVGITNCHIYQMAFKNGTEIPISSVEMWAEFPPEQIITNVDRLLVGRLKCPVINRDNLNSVNGVPITFGLDEIVSQAKIAYKRYNQEFSDKETKIFADKSVFSKDAKTGKSYIPKGMQNLFMKIRGAVDSTSIETYSPDIRDTSLENSIERNLRMIELFIGIGEGVISKSTLTYTNVDEVKASRSATFAFITNFRSAINQCIEDLMYSIDVFCNANSITSGGKYEVAFDWSDGYMESSQERFNQLIQALSVEVVDKAEVRAWVQSEDLETAKKWIEENNPENIALEPKIEEKINVEPTINEEIVGISTE